MKLQIPGGYLSGKWWGPKNVRPILCIHGWLDNCGSFDKLIPLLPQEHAYLVFDLPGHGVSENYGPGMIYSYYDTVVLIERIRREYNWDKVSIIGHSLGGLCSFFYSSIYPDHVDMVVALDSFEPYISDSPAFMKFNIETLLQEDARVQESEPPSYDYEELLDKVVKGSHGSVDRENAKYLLTRNMKKSTKYPRKYYFNYDRRLRGFDRPSKHPAELMQFAKNIICPVYYCLGEDSYLRPFSLEATQHIRQYLQDHNPDFHVRFGPGNHHFHLTHPDEYCQDIGRFIRKYRPTLTPHSHL